MKKLVAMLVLASGFFAAAPATAEDFLNLKLPGVLGTSTVANHVGEIVILSFSTGVSAPTNQKGVPQSCSDLNVLKVTDQTSPALFQHTIFGVDFPQAILTYSQSNDRGVVDIYSIKLNNVSITSVQDSGSVGGGVPTEALSLKSTSWVVSYTPVAGGQPVTATVNCIR